MNCGVFKHKRLLRGLVMLLAVLQVAMMFPVGIGALGDTAEKLDDDIVDGRLTVTLKDSDGKTIDPDPETGKYNDVPRDAAVEIKYEFSLPNDNGLVDPATGEELEGYEEYDYVNGDYFTVALPFQLDFSGMSEQWPIVLSQEGKIIGEVTFEPGSDGSSSVARVTLTEKGGELSDLKGEFVMDGKLRTEVADGHDPVSITLQFDGQTISIGYKDNPVSQVNVALGKEGAYSAADNTITWTVTVKPDMDISGLTLTDTYSVNQTYVGGSFSQVTTVGESKTVTPVTEGLLVEESTRTLTYALPDMAANETLTYSYKTKPTSTAFAAENGTDETVVFGNTAKVLLDGTEKASKLASVTLDWVNKTGKADDNDVRLIHWTVVVNNPAQTLNGAVITDTLQTGLALKEDTVKLKLGSSTLTVPKDTGTVGAQTPGTFRYNESTRVLTYVFADPLTGKATLTYDTTVTAADSSYNGNDKTSFVNDVEFSWNGNAGGIPSDSASVGVGKGVIDKSAGGKINYDDTNPIINWTVTVNRNKIAITNAVVEDTIPAGQEYVTGSFTINDMKDAQPNEMNGTLTASANSVKYEFGAARTINETYTITYQTRIIDKSSLYKNGEAGFGNSVTLSGDQVKTGQGGSFTQKYDSQLLDKSIVVAYDYTTREVTWKLVINRNKLPLTNAVLIDTLPEGTEYAGDFTITDSTGAPYLGEGTLTLPNETSPRTLKYEFAKGDANKITDTYTVTFKTRVLESALYGQGNKTFTNNAELEADEIKTDVTASWSHPVTNKIVEKKADYVEGADFIDWAVDINTNRLQLTDITVSDTLQEGLALDEASVKLIRLVQGTDGSLTEETEAVAADSGVYTFEYANQVMTLTLTGETDQAYRLKFTTDVLADRLNVSNRITFNGSGLDVQATSTVTKVVDINAGGSGSGSNGSVKVVKTDSVTGEKIAGAQFALYDYKGVQVGSIGTTVDGGEFTFSPLKFKNYTLKEVSAPDGYLLGDTEYKFRLSGANPEQTYTFENAPAVTDLVFKKLVKGSETPVPGAEFTLYRIDGENETEVAKAVSGSDGTVTFADIPAGSYVIRETRAPGGFYKNDQEIAVQVARSADQKTMVVTGLPESVENTPIPGESFGSIQVTKTDESGKALAGATFTLYNASGTAVQTAVSGSDGIARFTMLSYGSYTVKETAAPEGYEASGETLSVTVNSVVTSTFTVINKKLPDKPTQPEGPGSIRVQKLDENRVPLAGATFSLRDAEGNVLATATSGENGLVIFDKLAYGVYTLCEDSAPEGYRGCTSVKEVIVDGEVPLSFNAINVREELLIEDPDIPLGWEEIEDPDVPLVNVPDGELPKTGVVGDASALIPVGALMIAAGILLGRKRRGETA